MERGSGILMHISSLPSAHGIGTFGREARRFVKLLQRAGQKYWQVLPLNPTSYGDSPYQSFSAFALNPYFVDLDDLVKKGYLTKKEIRSIKGGTNLRYVDYGKIYQERFVVLRKAFHTAYPLMKEKLEKFLKKNRSWLESYADFMLLKDKFGGESWLSWPRNYKFHHKKTILDARKEHQDDFWFWVFVQYEAYQQYMRLHRYASSKGIQIIGDMPIYVATDSADVWANPTLFKLDARRNPALVAGVPPDYFSETGQLWGNPIYNWEKMKKSSYRWWKKRVKHMSKLYDCLRIDHFRGFESYWEVPAKEETAIHGEWVKGPGHEIIDAFRLAAPKLQIIAEDLGIITDEVKELLAYSGYPGLKVLEFAFNGNPNDPFLPHLYEENSVAYIGTHDNDVLLHFIEDNPIDRERMCQYYHYHGDNEGLLDVAIESLMKSKANVVIFTMQDLLHLGKYTRMNLPGSSKENWQFRVLKTELTEQFAENLYQKTGEANRL